MISRTVFGGQQRFRTSEFLCSALFIRLHGLIIPDFVGKVSVRDGELRWNVRHNICVMDDPPSFRETGSDEAGPGFIADSGLSKSVKLVDMAKECFNIEGSDGSESRPQTVSSDVYLCISVERSQFLNLASNVPFHSRESIVESLMNAAPGTSRVGDLV